MQLSKMKFLKNAIDANSFHTDLDPAKYLELVRTIKTPGVVLILFIHLVEIASA